MATVLFESLDMSYCHIWLSILVLAMVGQRLVVKMANVHALVMTFEHILHFSKF